MNRYGRQTILDEIGKEGQKKLFSSNVAIVGCGALGSMVAPYLAGMGVGNLRLIDGDNIERSNLHRQVFYHESADGNKAEFLTAQLRKLNQEITINAFPSHVEKNNIDEALVDCDLVIECTDSVFAKYLVNDYCHLENIPLVYGAIHKYEGYISSFPNNEETDIHLRDIFPEMDENLPTCAEVGVFPPIAGVIAMLQVNEAIKQIIGLPPNLKGKLLTYDILNNQQHILNLKKTFSYDIEEIFEINTYQPNKNSDNEISPLSLYPKIKEIQLISMLDLSDPINIISGATFKSVDDLLNYNWNSEKKETVIYCRSGQQSKHLIGILKRKFPSAPIFSLQGGIIALHKLIKE